MKKCFSKPSKVSKASTRKTAADTFDGSDALKKHFWAASVDVKGDTRTTRRSIVKTISANGPSPLRAIAALVELLDADDCCSPATGEESAAR